MPDGTSLAEIKISELPVGTAANPTDQLEANQAGVSRSITVGQVATYVSGTLPTPPTSLPPNGLASGDLAGSYPSPTIKTSVGLTGTPTAPTPTPGTDNSTKIATTAFVQSAVAGVSVTIPAGTIAFGGAGGVVTGNSTLAWDNTGKSLAITGYTGAAAAFSAAGSVPASPAVDAFLMSIANPSGNTGNIFRLRAGAAGTTDQFKVDMTGDAAASGSIQAFALSAPPAGGNGAFAYFLGNFTGGNIGLYFGTGAPTLSTFGKYGSLYMNAATPGIPYYNNNGTTGWDQLVGLTATQTLTNKTITGYTPTASLPTSLPPNGAAGGALNGTYPNPGIAPSGTNGQVMTTVGGVAVWATPSAGAPLRGFLSGFVHSHPGGTQSLTVGAGQAADSTNAVSITGASFTKTLAAFAAGSGNGGMGTGLTVAINTWYFPFAAIIGGSFDIFFDTTPIPTHIPAGTTAYRRLRPIKTDGSSNIIAHTGKGDLVQLVTTTVDTTGFTPLTTVNVPPGIQVIWQGRCFLTAAAGGYGLDWNTPGTTSNNYVASNTVGSGGGAQAASGTLSVLTNTAQQIAYVQAGTVSSGSLTTYGWIDDCGRFD